MPQARAAEPQAGTARVTRQKRVRIFDLGPERRRKVVEEKPMTMTDRSDTVAGGGAAAYVAEWNRLVQAGELPDDVRVRAYFFGKWSYIGAQAERIARLEGKTRELLVAIQGDPYSHGVWAWREGLATDSISYQHTPEAVRVVRAFARLEALLGLRDELAMPEHETDPTARATGLSEAELGAVRVAYAHDGLPLAQEKILDGIEEKHGSVSRGMLDHIDAQAERITALEAERDRLRAALKGLIEAAETLCEDDVSEDFIPLIEAKAALPNAGESGDGRTWPRDALDMG